MHKKGGGRGLYIRGAQYNTILVDLLHFIRSNFPCVFHGNDIEAFILFVFIPKWAIASKRGESRGAVNCGFCNSQEKPSKNNMKKKSLKNHFLTSFL